MHTYHTRRLRLGGLLLACLALVWAGPLGGTNVQFVQSSNPAGVVNQTSFPLIGSVVTTVTAPDTNANYRFTYWTVNGVRWADPSGATVNPATFQVDGATSAVANYVLQSQDSDADGLPDWWELRYFGSLAYSGTDDPDGDGYNNAYEYAFGMSPTVADERMPGGTSRRRGLPLNVAVGASDSNWFYGGVSRRRSATTTVVLNPDAYAILQETSSPSGIIARSRVISKGATVNLSTPPDPSAGYRFTGWLIGGVRYDHPYQLQPIPITVNSDTTVVARYISATDDTDGDGIPDWQEWFYFNSLQYGPSSSLNGDGFTYAQKQLRGLSQIVADQLDMGGISRRRSRTFIVDTTGRLPYRLTSDPATILEQTQYLAAGTLITVPDKKNSTYSNYKFAWWDLNGVRQQDPSGVALTTFSFTLNTASTVTAHYVDPGLYTNAGVISDWTQWTIYGSLANGPTSDTDGDGFTYAQELLRGFSPRVVDSLDQGGVSRRRSVLTTVNAVFLANLPAIGANAAINLTPMSARLTAQINPIGADTTAYFQWGLTSAYGNLSPTQDLGSGDLAISDFADISGLTPNTQYHFRVVATSSRGTSQGSDYSFVTPQGTFSWWIGTYPDLADKSAGGDPDHDGIPNLLEYLLNGNPGTPSTAILPTVSKIANNFVFTFNRRAASVQDTTQIFQYSTDLSGWTDVMITSPTDAKVAVGVADANGIQKVTVTIPASANARMFGRIKVLLP